MTPLEKGRPDHELWASILNGDQAAWRELVVRYKTLVYATCTYLGLSQSEAGDAFQQTWILLYERRRQVRDPERLSSWLVTTARREALRFKARAASIAPLDTCAEAPDGRPDPEEELLLIERQAVLESALDRIDKPCRDLLRLFFFEPEGRSYDDIACRLGYSPNTLGAKRKRCLERLRRILENMGYLAERNSRKEPLL